MKKKLTFGILLSSLGLLLGVNACKKSTTEANRDDWACNCNGQTVSLSYLGKISRNDATQVCQAAGCTLK